ncbi:MAG: hypothetical protein JO257_34240 [Deltaproteobacteria bacterium]|nr:hypothetical protein [Deltaproteobacteria bacterium]
MRLVVALVSILAIACGSHSNGSSDAPGAGGDSGGGGGDSGGDSGGGGGGTTIHVTLNNHPTNAAMYSFLVAYQDGSSAWKLAGAPSGDVYSFNVNSPSWGVAWTCIGNSAPQAGGGQIRQVAEAHFAVAERTSLSFDVPPRCTDNAPTTVALTGTVSNRSGGGVWLVEFGGKTGFVNPQTGGYRIEALPGTRDVVLLHVQSNGGGTTSDFVTTEALVDRAVTVNAATTHDLDASSAVATQAFNVTIGVPLNGRALATTVLYSAGGTTPTLDRVSSQFESDALDATQGVAGDVYDQQMLVASNGQTAIVTNATATPGDQTFSAPPPLGGATSQVTGSTPYPIIHTTWAPYASTIGYVWTATQTPTLQQCASNIPCTIVWSSLLSPGVTGNSPGYTMPDLSALTGWSANLAFVTGTMVTGYAEAGKSSGGASDFPPVTPPPAGTKRTYVRSDFTVTP